MRITHDLLVTLDACVEQRDAFAAAFPDGLTVSGEPDAYVIASVVEAKLDVDWLCVRALTETAFAAYREAMAPALAAYLEATAAAYAAYDESIAGARDAYDKAMATAFSAYLEATAPAYNTYCESRATAAWRLLANPDNIRPEYRQ